MAIRDRLARRDFLTLYPQHRANWRDAVFFAIDPKATYEFAVRGLIQLLIQFSRISESSGEWRFNAVKNSA